MKLLLSIIGALSVTGAAALPDDTVSKQGSAHVVFVGIDEMPIPVPPSELAKARRHSTDRADDGVSTIETAPAVVRQFLSNVDIAIAQAESLSQGKLKGTPAFNSGPIVFKDLTQLKLGFVAALAYKGELIAVAPHGTMVGDTWTGVELFYRLHGAGVMRLSETDMKATGGKFYMLKEAINTQVAGQPAISKVFTDGNGQNVEEILWVHQHKLYILTFAPTMAKSRYGLTKTDNQISATSLARSIR